MEKLDDYLKVLGQQNPLISIIVPVYNVEAYLERCIDSILKQDFCDFELLLIDDGSTDGSGIICDTFQKTDGRIKVFHKENGGASSARNKGLDEAKGEWVVFIDADDYVKTSYLSALLNDAQQVPDVELVFHTGSMALARNQIEAEYLFSEKRIYDSATFSVMMEELRLYWCGQPVAKLFKREVIENNNIRFPLGVRIAEDCYFFFCYLNCIGKVVFSCVNNYIYVNRIDSAVHQHLSFDIGYMGYKCFCDPSPYTVFIKKYAVSEQIANTYYSSLSRILHWAIIEIANVSELKSVEEADWHFFEKYFKPSSSKSALDRQMINRFHSFPFVLIPYLWLGRLMRSINIWWKKRQGKW